jgi:hypothetical protein
MDANGEKFRGFEGNWALCFDFVLKHLPCMLYRVEYIVKTPPTTLVGNICNEIQVHWHVHIVGEFCSIYDGSTNITYFCSI